MTVGHERFDAADYLDSPEVMAEYSNAAIEEGDGELVAEAIGDIMRAAGLIGWNPA